MTRYEYVYVMDNNGNICVDNNQNLIYISYEIVTTAEGIVVRRIRNRLFPCIQCMYYNSQKFPLTQIHAEAIRSRAYDSQVSRNCGNAYIDIIGECLDFKQKS